MAETPESFDAIVIGAGQSGGPLSTAFARAGKKTAIVEREHVGGTCINEGCTPTKTMIASGRVAYLAKRGADYGVLTGPIRVDETVVRRRKRDIVESFRGGSERRITSTPGVELMSGEASFTSEKTLAVRLADLGIDDVPLVGVAKGPDRNAGRERFFREGKPPFSLAPNDPVLYYLQRLRDEAHRFAIGAHRQRRTKAITGSPLDEIPGIGAKRKRALLHHFGSSRGVAGAGLTDLERVEGISKMVAKKIYDHFHAEG